MCVCACVIKPPSHKISLTHTGINQTSVCASDIKRGEYQNTFAAAADGFFAFAIDVFMDMDKHSMN
jgi:hypothetical protein